MKTKTIILLALWSVSAFAQVSDNVSSTCYRYATGRMTQSESYHFCSNVADNCFRAFISSNNLTMARKACLNVSSACFQELRKTSKEEAARSCENVLNSCYVSARNDGLSIKESLARCNDAAY